MRRLWATECPKRYAKRQAPPVYRRRLPASGVQFHHKPLVNGRQVKAQDWPGAALNAAVFDFNMFGDALWDLL